MSKAATKEQLGSAALRSQGYAADVAAAAAAAIQELGDAKADKAAAFTATLVASEWIEEETTADVEDGAEGGDVSLAYPFYYDIAATSVTANDRADVAIEPASLYMAGACGFCPTTETLAGIIRVRAQQAPDGDIGVECWITKGVDQ